MVVIMVDSVTAESPQIRVTCTVTMAAAARWMILVQIRMVVMARSKLSRMRRAFTARVSPRSDSVFKATLDTDAKAVSAIAKYIAPKRSRTTISHDIRLPSSIKDVTLPCHRSFRAAKSSLRKTLPELELIYHKGLGMSN